MSRSEPLLSVLAAFESAFSPPTWRNMQVLIVGTLLARGRRTVTAALRQRGLGDASHVSLSHHVLNRAPWSAMEGSRRLLVRRVRTVATVAGELTLVIDETLEWRWGRRMTRRGPFRAPLASRKARAVATRGWRWLVWTVVITPPWTQRSWAVPVLRVPASTPAVSRRRGLRPKTGPPRARQMRLAVRRWRPEVEMTVIGDQTSSGPARGGAWARWDVRLVAPRRMDAALYKPAPPRRPGMNGRPRVQGERLPQLQQGRKEAQPPWHRRHVRWDNGRRRLLDVTSGTAVWDSDWPAWAADPRGART